MSTPITSHPFVPCNTTAQWLDGSPRCLCWKKGEEWRCHSSKGITNCGQPESAHAAPEPEPCICDCHDSDGSNRTVCGCRTDGCAGPAANEPEPDPRCMNVIENDTSWCKPPRHSIYCALFAKSSAGSAPKDRLRDRAMTTAESCPQDDNHPKPSACADCIRAALEAVVRRDMEIADEAEEWAAEAMEKEWGLEEKP